MSDKQDSLGSFGVTSSTNTPRFSKLVSLNLSIIDQLREHKASDVASALKLTKSALSYHLKRLQVFGIIEKRGYGVWEVKIKEDHVIREILSKQVQRKYPLRSRTGGGVHFIELLSDSVRTHAIQAVVNVPPNLRRWTQVGRRKFLSERGIAFKAIQQGEQIMVFDCRVWLTRKSLVVWMPREWFVSDADTGYSYAVFELQGIIRKAESLLGVSLRRGGKYEFRIARQHHALVKNALAKQYNKEKQKFYCFDQRGLWLLIDDSDGNQELEGVANRGPNGKESRDNVTHIQTVFNEFKSTGTSPQQILDMIGSNASQLNYYAENVVSHVKAVQGIEKALADLNAFLQRGKQ